MSPSSILHTFNEPMGAPDLLPKDERDCTMDRLHTLDLSIDVPQHSRDSFLGPPLGDPGLSPRPPNWDPTLGPPLASAGAAIMHSFG